MQIKYSGTAPISVLLQAQSSAPSHVIFMPGVNLLPDDIWSEVKKNKLVSGLLSSSMMVENAEAAPGSMHVAFKVSVSSKKK